PDSHVCTDAKAELGSTLLLCFTHTQLNVDLTNEDRYTALHLAVLDNSVEIVELLLSFGADPSIKDHRGNTCFHQAVAMKSNDCLKLLVEHLRTKEDLDCFNNS
ncbi:Nuclear factor of kappa light polypeptide gene enhancer in Bcells 1, partial [Caligus rogercresseyi]